MNNIYLENLDKKDISGKRVVMRVDFNEPIENDTVVSSFRIESAIPTIKFLIKNGTKEVVLIAHLGRPEGKKDEKLSLKPVAQKLKELLAQNSKLKTQNYNSEIKTDKIKDFEAFEISENIKLLENIRFYPEEEKSDEIFSNKLSKLGNIFVFEAFGTINENASSITGISKILPTCLGLRVKREIDELNEIMTNHEKPFCVILGGAKVKDKLPVIKNLVNRTEVFLIGGAIANTFLAAKDKEIGKSFVEMDMLEEAMSTANKVLASDRKDIFLPVDFVTSKDLQSPKGVGVKNRQTVVLDDYIVDIGPITISMFVKQIASAGTIFWNGNMGISEIKDFENGTKEIAHAIASIDGKKVVAGGDTVAYLEKNNMLGKFDFVSVGGGATLAYLSGEKMPILEILNKSQEIPNSKKQ